MCWKVAPWRVIHVEPRRAVLAFEHRPGEWPWHYRAEQSFALSGHALEISLSCQNLSQGDMPCGLGLHPYFPCSPTTILNAATTGVWTIDDSVLPVSRIAPQGRYDLALTHICGRGLDNGYDGWNGSAEILWPEHQTRVRIDAPASRLQIYAPAAKNIVVVEPVTNANAALNAQEESWPALGIQVLRPLEEARFTVQFEVHAPKLRPGDRKIRPLASSLGVSE